MKKISNIKYQISKIQIKNKIDKNGLTLLELLLVVAIVGLIGVLASGYYARLLTQNAVANTTDQLTSALRKAQHYSMMGKQSGGVWGVKYTASPKQITLFLQGNSGFDENYGVNNAIAISGLTEVTFGHFSGLPMPTGPTTITVSGNNDNESITINTQGMVSRN